MNFEEKKAFRIKKLRELYDFNEEHAGRDAQVKYTDLYSNEEDKKEHLALEYLNEKGLINYKILGRNLYSVKITSRGIDFIENES